MIFLFIIAIIVLAVVLFRMLGQSEKTYTYNHTVTISFRPDGSEQVEKGNETGVVFLTRKAVTIDGESFLYKSPDRKKIEARLNQEGGTLKSISVKQTGGGQKFFYLDKMAMSLEPILS